MSEINSTFKIGDIVTGYSDCYNKIINIIKRPHPFININPILTLQPLVNGKGENINHLPTFECDESWCQLVDKELIENKIAEYSKKMNNIWEILELIEIKELFSKINLSLTEVSEQLDFNKIWLENNEIILQVFVLDDYDIKQIPFIDHPQLTHIDKQDRYSIDIHFKLGD